MKKTVPILKILYVAVLAVVFTHTTQAQTRDILDSGGILSPEQASYDVKYYNLTLDVWPDDKSISGTVTIRSLIVQPMYYLVLDLDTMLTVSAIGEALFLENDANSQDVVQKQDVTLRPAVLPLHYTRRAGQIWIDLGRTRQPGETLQVIVSYHGKPREARHAPWDGVFTWAHTKSGAHWIATTCQGEGADLWWPCKDHVSDEPDSMDLHITVPAPLVVASNGRLVGTSDAGDDRSTYSWHISQPINIYNVALNIAPYELIESEYKSVTGETFPFQFYVLPEDFKKGQKIFPEFQEHMRFFEELLGPYPFRADKYGVVQTPHLGMEHQSIIAYGANFKNGSMTGGKDWGFDALHHHELSHEWWGNLITNAGWEDMWIHEGFGTYMQALYCEQLGGQERYDAFMQSSRDFKNTFAVAPRETKTSNEIYKAPIYPKGAWILHTLRYYIGDEAFFSALRQLVYPTLKHASATDGSQCRFVTTDDFLRIAESTAGKDLEWFFDLYLRQPALPVLYVSQNDREVTLRWSSPTGGDFPMPLEVGLGDRIKTVVIPVTEEGITIKLRKGESFQADPGRRILCEIELSD
ncbi:MAG: M1 family peptidase [Bacteroidetes bacterium]|nr:MAG: M1 family peptidase [Bacteroidota bacterium]